MAIHGIGAHPDDTWCKKVDAGGLGERYVNWLSDASMLPAVVPQARVIRYGYESQWFGEETISLKASTVAQRLLRSLTRERKVSLVCAAIEHHDTDSNLETSLSASDVYRTLLWRACSSQGSSDSQEHGIILTLPRRS